MEREPRYTKIRGERRYYDHVLGKSISEHAYQKLRRAEKTKQAAPAAIPTPIRAMPRETSDAPGPSLLAQKLLQESMLGSPVVETPAAPAIKQIATDVSEDTKKSLESISETVAPLIASALVLVGTLAIPEDWRWLCPDEEEAELMIAPASRIVVRNLGVTGKELDDNGKDMVAILTAFIAYMAGAKMRRDEYWEMVESEQEAYEQAAPDIARGRRDHGGGNGRNTNAAPYADAASLRGTPDAYVLGRNTEQGRPAPGPANGARNGGASAGNGTARQQNEASRVRELLAADFEGRRRLGLA